MRRVLIFLLVLLSICFPAHALTPTPSPSPIPQNTYTPIASRVHVSAYFEGEWHALRNEVIWAQDQTPNGLICADGMLHFMPLLAYAQNTALSNPPETASLEDFAFRIDAEDGVESVSGSLQLLRLEGEELKKLEQQSEDWGELEPGRYLLCINVSASGNGSGVSCVSLLWANL